MPSAPGYKRNLVQEGKTAKARGEQGTGHDSKSAIRHRARRVMLKKGMVATNDGKDVDHIRGTGAGNAATNLQVKTASANRSFARTKGAGMKGKK